MWTVHPAAQRLENAGVAQGVEVALVHSDPQSLRGSQHSPGSAERLDHLRFLRVLSSVDYFVQSFGDVLCI